MPPMLRGLSPTDRASLSPKNSCPEPKVVGTVHERAKNRYLPWIRESLVRTMYHTVVLVY